MAQMMQHMLDARSRPQGGGPPNSMIFSASTNEAPPSTVATRYGELTGSVAPDSVETPLGRSVLRRSGILRNLWVFINVPAGAGASWTVTLRVNGVNQALQVVLTGAVVQIGSDLVNAIAVVAYDQVSLGIVPSVAPAPAALDNMSYAMEFEAGSQNMCILNGAPLASPAIAATEYNSVVSDSNNWSTEVNAQQVIPRNGTLRNLYVFLEFAPGGGGQYTFTLYVNGIATLLTVTIVGAATAAENIVNAIAVNAGDTLSMESVPLNQPNAPKAHWNIEFYPS